MIERNINFDEIKEEYREEDPEGSEADVEDGKPILQPPRTNKKKLTSTFKKKPTGETVDMEEAKDETDGKKYRKIPSIVINSEVASDASEPNPDFEPAGGNQDDESEKVDSEMADSEKVDSLILDGIKDKKPGRTANKKLTMAARKSERLTRVGSPALFEPAAQSNSLKPAIKGGRRQTLQIQTGKHNFKLESQDVSSSSGIDNNKSPSSAAPRGVLKQHPELAKIRSDKRFSTIAEPGKTFDIESPGAVKSKKVGFAPSAFSKTAQNSPEETPNPKPARVDHPRTKSTF